MRQKRILAIVGAALLASVGILAWTTRNSGIEPQAVPTAASLQPVSNSDYLAPAQMPAYATRPAVRTIEGAQPVETLQAYPERRSVVAKRGSASRIAAAPYQSQTYVKKRSKKKSLAIVGGSAAGGALIGGLAGGGKGALIGGLVGGGGGLVYDRLTHKKVVNR
jgi:hypothetical protein